MKTRLNTKGILTLAVAFLLVSVISSLVFADNLKDDVVAGGNDTITTGGSTVINYWIQDTGGSCDAGDGSSATVTIIVPTGVTATPSSLTFYKCNTGNQGTPNNTQSVTFTSSTVGNFSIKASVSDTAGSYNTTPAAFTLYVNTATTSDNTPPVLSLPSNITAEATGLNGAVVTFSASANDAVDGSVALTCSPASGSTFTLGATTVNCSASDSHNNTANGSFTVTVQDTLPPTISGTPSNQTLEANGPSGALFTYTLPIATDLVDGNVTVACNPASGSTFALDTTTTVTCTASDKLSHTAQTSFTVYVKDTTPPGLTLPSNITAEATGPTGAVVTYTTSASDLVDGAVSTTCSPASGATFPLGATTVTCSATDSHNNTANGSFTVTVQDTTPPTVTVPADITAEATGPGGASVSFSASASDLVDGSVAPTCTPASGSTFALGTTAVSCSATDAHGNTGTKGFKVTVQDTTPPTITWDASSIADGASYYFNNSAPSAACTASDLVSGTVPCTVTGSSSLVGAHTLTATAKDAAGNTATATRSYTVLAWTLSAFFQPVDMGIVNNSKAGSTVPLKFTVFAGPTELTDTAIVQTFTQKIGCVSGTGDDIEQYATGATSLRYDATGHQFIFNWQTPKISGACYRVTVTTQDGSTKYADFRLK